MEAVIQEVCSQVDRSQVRAIGVSGQQHGFVPLDGGGKVIRPAKLWCDTSTAGECALLTRRLGGAAAVIRKAGLPFLPGYTAPKILWLKRREPENFKRLRHVLLPHDYLNFHLTGNYSMEYGDASGTALMDIRRRVWSQPVLSAIDPKLGDWLPSLKPSHEPAGELLPALARAYGLPDGVIVSSGGGDNMMGAIGTGNVKPGIVTASFGTSGTIYACSPRPVVDPQGDRGLLLLDRGMASAPLHDECHDRDRAGARALRDGPRGHGRRGVVGSGRVRRNGAAAVSGG